MALGLRISLYKVQKVPDRYAQPRKNKPKYTHLFLAGVWNFESFQQIEQKN